MNQAHFHLILSHLPLIGTVFGIAVLAAGFAFKSQPVKRTALVIFILSSLVAIASFLTGEGAEEIVEKIPGMSEAVIEEHEDFATVYLWLIGSLGVVSALTIFFEIYRPSTANLLYIASLVIALGVSAGGWNLGRLGGEIRHTEIRSGANVAQPGDATNTPESATKDDDD